MYCYRVLMPHDIVSGREFPINTVVLCLDNGIKLACSNFYYPHKEKMELLAYIPREGKWVKTYMRNNHTKIMLDFYYAHIRQRKRKSHVNFAQLMKHNTKPKRKSGTRIYNNSINSPVKHPQITQYAYWEHLNNAKSGNASMVGASIFL